MKKIISIVLLCTMLLACFAGCGAKQGQMDLGSYAGEVAVDSLSGEGTLGITDALRANVEKAKAGTFADDEVDVWDGTTVDTSWSTDSGKTYTITTAAAMAGFRKLLKEGTAFKNWTITLGKNIDFGGATIDGVATAFEGTFDGGNYVICNYKMTLAENQGFFGCIKGINSATSTRTFGNVGLVGAECTSIGKSTGSVAGYVNNNTTVTNVYSDAKMKASGEGAVVRIGGLFGRFTAGKNKNFTNCEFAGTIDLSDRTMDDKAIGGIVGYGNGGTPTFTNCLNTGVINAPLADGVGGIVGSADSVAGSMTYINCKNTASLTGKDEVGGIVGSVKTEDLTGGNQTFDGCTNSGSLTGECYVGGLMGRCCIFGKDATISTDGQPKNRVTITNCSSSGNIVAKGIAGGLAGTVHALGVTVDGCTVSGNLNVTFNKIDTKGDGNGVGGLFGVLFVKGLAMPADHVPAVTLGNCTVTGTLTVDKYALVEVDAYVGLTNDIGATITNNLVASEAVLVEAFHNAMVGYQESAKYTVEEKEYYDLRFVAVLEDSEAVKAAGFKVAINYKGAEELRVEEVYAKTLYTSIKGTDGISEVTYTAAEFGGDYLFALVIEGIPTDYTFAADSLEVIITPFTAQDAETLDEGITVTKGKVVIEESAS